jgi:hypothetical protein
MAIIIAGIIILNKETPADFILESSYLSDKFPKTIIEEINIVRGMACGTMVIAK